jgi:hypothetical protein
MKKLTIVAVGLLLLIPSLAFSDTITLRLGYYLPRALSNSYLNAHPDSLWTIEFDQMSFLPKDFRSGIVGIGYDYFVSRNISLSLTAEGYNKSQVGFYRDWVLNTLTEGDFAFPFDFYLGDDIVHSFRVSITPIELSLKEDQDHPLRRRRRQPGLL